MDGTMTRTVNWLSRLTKVEELRRKIQELFHVEPGLQRLFYRGKQVNPPCRLPARPEPLFLPGPGTAPGQQPPAETFSSPPLVHPASRVPEGEVHRNLRCLREEGTKAGPADRHPGAGSWHLKICSLWAFKLFIFFKAPPKKTNF